jgi:hypothetical protein
MLPIHLLNPVGLFCLNNNLLRIYRLNHRSSSCNYGQKMELNPSTGLSAEKTEIFTALRHLRTFRGKGTASMIPTNYAIL